MSSPQELGAMSQENKTVQLDCDWNRSRGQVHISSTAVRVQSGFSQSSPSNKHASTAPNFSRLPPSSAHAWNCAQTKNFPAVPLSPPSSPSNGFFPRRMQQPLASLDPNSPPSSARSRNSINLIKTRELQKNMVSEESPPPSRRIPSFMASTKAFENARSAASRANSRLPRPVPIATPSPVSRLQPSSRSATKITGSGQKRDVINHKKEEHLPTKSSSPNNWPLETPPFNKRISLTPDVLQKPLPSPPVIQVITNSPPKVSRTLLDASERPLRRLSHALDEEDWPSLSPEKLSRSCTEEEQPSARHFDLKKPSYHAIKAKHDAHTRLLNLSSPHEEEEAMAEGEEYTLPTSPTAQRKLNEARNKLGLTIDTSVRPERVIIIDESLASAKSEVSTDATTVETALSPSASTPCEPFEVMTPQEEFLSDDVGHRSPTYTSGAANASYKSGPRYTPSPPVPPRSINRRSRYVDVVEASRSFSAPVKQHGIPVTKHNSSPSSRPGSRLQRSPRLSQKAVVDAASEMKVNPNNDGATLLNADRGCKSLDETSNGPARTGFESIRIKRQSTPTGLSSSDFGPTLKIHRDAEDIIMGKDDDTLSIKSSKSSKSSRSHKRKSLRLSRPGTASSSRQSCRDELKVKGQDTDVPPSPSFIPKIYDTRPSTANSQYSTAGRGPADALAILEGVDSKATHEPNRLSMLREAVGEQSPSLNKRAKNTNNAVTGRNKCSRQRNTASTLVASDSEYKGTARTPSRLESRSSSGSSLPPSIPRREVNGSPYPSRTSSRQSIASSSRHSIASSSRQSAAPSLRNSVASSSRQSVASSSRQSLASNSRQSVASSNTVRPPPRSSSLAFRASNSSIRSSSTTTLQPTIGFPSVNEDEEYDRGRLAQIASRSSEETVKVTTARLDVTPSVTAANGSKHTRSRSRTRRAMSRIGGLFQKSESTPPVPAIPDAYKSGTKRFHVNSNGSPMSNLTPSFLKPTKASASRLNLSSTPPPIRRGPSPPRSVTSRKSSNSSRNADSSRNTPSITSPELSSVAETTKSTFALVKKAQEMAPGVEKERMLHVSAVLLNTISSAREAYRAMTVAEDAAQRARLSYEVTQKSMEELTRVMGQPGTLMNMLKIAGTH